MFGLFSTKEKSIYEIKKTTMPTVEDTKDVVAKALSGKIIRPMYENRELIPCRCGYCYSKMKSVPNLNYIPNKRSRDLYYTSDGFCVVSQKFKDFCVQYLYGNLIFQKLHNCDFYFFEPQGLFKTDIHWIPFNDFKYWCDACKSYAEITGGVLKSKSFELMSDDFILRTDSFRGLYEYKYPIIVIGLETENKMKAYGLKGISFENVYG